MNPFSPSPSPSAPSVTPPARAPSSAASPGPGPVDAAAPADAPAAPAADDAAVVAPAVLKFKACRWRCSPEDGEFCTHRDVLPFAGKNDFKAESWCPECAFYKLRRTPKKREWVDRNAY